VSDQTATVQAGSNPIPAIDLAALLELPFDDIFSNSVAFALILGVCAVALLITGFAMKFACKLTGGGRITIRRGIVATASVSAVYLIAAWLKSISAFGASPMVAFVMTILAGTLTLAWILWQNPIRALATGILASILQTVLLFGFFSTAFIMASRFVPEQSLLQFAEHAQSLTDSLAKEVLPGDIEKNRQLLSVKSLFSDPTESAKVPSSSKTQPMGERGMKSNPHYFQ
jgi:hypothetical protein